MGTGLVMYRYSSWCPGIGPSFCFSFLLIPPLLFEEDTGEHHDLLLLNDVYVHAKDERNYSNSFRVMAKNITCTSTGTLTPDLVTKAVFRKGSDRTKCF